MRTRGKGISAQGYEILYPVMQDGCVILSSLFSGCSRPSCGRLDVHETIIDIMRPAVLITLRCIISIFVLHAQNPLR